MRLLLTCLLVFTTFSPALAQSENLSLRLTEAEPITLGRLHEPSTDAQDEALPEAAKSLLAELYASPANRTASIVYDLRRLQDSLTRLNELDEAVAVRRALRQVLAQQQGIQPDPGNFPAYRGQNGKQFTFAVVGRKLGSVWGSGIYTDDSSLSSVAVHAGLLAEGEAGIIRVTIRPGQEQYQGSERNGITSQSYGSFGGSYTIALVRKGKHKSAKSDTETNKPESFLPKAAQEILTDLKEQENDKDFRSHLRRGVGRLLEMQRTYARAARLDEAVAIKEAVFELLVILYDAIPVPGSFTEYRDYVGQSGYFIVKGRKTGSIWGSGTYTDDSQPGVAAVHAGLLRPGQKGIVKVTIRSGMEAYEGSTQNGVTTSSYAEWQGSYQLEAIPDR